MTETTPIYLGEARILSWSHSDSRGRTITLQLPEDAPRHPFEGIPTGKEYGQRMQIVCVAIDDHEQPLDAKHAKRPKKRAPNAPVPDKTEHVAAIEKAERKRFSELPRSQQAGIKCGDDDFDKWLRSFYKDATHEDMTTLLYYHLGITSRKQLDTDPTHGDAWDRLLADFDVRHTVRS